MHAGRARSARHRRRGGPPRGGARRPSGRAAVRLAWTARHGVDAGAGQSLGGRDASTHVLDRGSLCGSGQARGSSGTDAARAGWSSGEGDRRRHLRRRAARSGHAVVSPLLSNARRAAPVRMSSPRTPSGGATGADQSMRSTPLSPARGRQPSTSDRHHPPGAGSARRAAWPSRPAMVGIQWPMIRPPPGNGAPPRPARAAAPPRAAGSRRAKPPTSRRRHG